MNEDRQTRERRRALTVGALALGALVVFGALVFALGPARVLRGRALAVELGFAGPIKPGASVRIAGIVVGTVTDVELLATSRDPERIVRVHARVEEDASSLVTDSARFYVTTLGVLGEHYLDIEPGPGGAPLPDGSTVKGVTLPRPDLLLPRAAGLLARADDLLPNSPEVMDLMKQAARLLARLDEILASDGGDALTQEGRALLADVRQLVRGAAAGVGDGAALKRTLEAAPAALVRADRLGASLEASDVQAVLAEARAAATLATALGTRLEQSPFLEATAQEELQRRLVAALDAIDGAGHRADRLLAVIEQKQGGAGRLFWDEAAADDLRGLLRGLRENPVRFLLQPGQ